MWRRKRPDSDFSAEVEAHLELEAERLRAEGLGEKEAREAAQRAFGNILQARERYYESGRWVWLDHLGQDVRYGLRTLRKNAAFTVVVVLTLGLGIGANTTIFSWINSTLLDPIPGARETGRIVSITRGTIDPGQFSYPDYRDLRDAARSFSGITAFTIRPTNLTGTGKPERVWGTAASANYFDVLGVSPLLGRTFAASEERKPGGDAVVVLGYTLWQRRYGGDTSIVGRSIRINQHPFTVIGVAPPDFQGSLTGLHMDLWIPLMAQRGVISNRDWLNDRGDDQLMAQGRLAPGVTAEQGRQELTLLLQHLAEQFPDAHSGQKDVGVYPLWRAPGGANRYFYVLLPMLMALAAVVLLLACANVTNLLLVRAAARRREMSIRLAIGARRGYLVRQMLVESGLLALGGGALGLLLTNWTAGTLGGFIPPTSFPVALGIHVDRGVLLAAVAISLLAALVFGLLPALEASGLAPAAVLKEESGGATGGRRRARLTSTLVAGQLALSVLLLVAAGLFIRGFEKAERFDPGFHPEHVLAATLDLFPAGYTRESGLEFERQLLAKLEATPDVQSATLANAVPLGLVRDTESVKLEGYAPQPREGMDIRSATVGPNYLRTLGIPLVEGRDFGADDTAATRPVAIVNQALAERYWPRQEALGKRVFAEDHWSTVVGVARNSNYDRLGEAPRPFLYLPMLQNYWTSAILLVRVAGEPQAFAPRLERAVHELNADMPLYQVAPMAALTQNSAALQRLAGTFVGAFGALALVLAGVGLYGIVAYGARERAHEIGIRRALGAGRGDVLCLVLGQGLRLTGAGLCAGLVFALLVARALRSQLFGVAPTDAVTFVAVALGLAAVALLSCAVPAYRATRVDPVAALRHE